MNRFAHSPQSPEDHPSGQEQKALLYFLRCSLAYQNQLLAEIKTLLEQLTLNSDPGQRKNSG